MEYLAFIDNSDLSSALVEMVNFVHVIQKILLVYQSSENTCLAKLLLQVCFYSIAT